MCGRHSAILSVAIRGGSGPTRRIRSGPEPHWLWRTTKRTNLEGFWTRSEPLLFWRR
jgi:hypothetical protein